MNLYNSRRHFAQNVLSERGGRETKLCIMRFAHSLGGGGRRQGAATKYVCPFALGGVGVAFFRLFSRAHSLFDVFRVVGRRKCAGVRLLLMGAAASR